MKLFGTRSFNKQREKLTGYFKIVRKEKRSSKWMYSCCYDSIFGEKEGDRLWTSLQENVIERCFTM
jgi:hypothetical protein